MNKPLVLTQPFKLFYQLLKVELLSGWRQPATILSAWLFFVMVSLLFPLTLPTQQALLQLIAPVIIWLAALLANLLTMPRLFESDSHQGVLIQYLLAPQALSLIVFVKVMSHWLMISLPLIASIPLLAVFFALTVVDVLLLMVTIILGSLIFQFVAAIAASLTLSLDNRGLLLALLVLPWYMPILMLGAGIVSHASDFAMVSGLLALLMAILLFLLTLGPVIIAGCLRISFD